MTILLVIIHVIVCVALIMIVLLQTGKGAYMGAAFGGGGSQTLFGATGASTFLSKATTIAAVVFMLTSLTLAYKAGNRSSTSILSDVPAAEQPAAPATEADSTSEAQPEETPVEAPTSTESAAPTDQTQPKP